MSEEIVEEAEYSFTDEESEEFKDLIAIGFVSGEGNVFGHTASFTTLSTREDIAVGLLIKDYVGSSAYERAYKTAVVAAALRELDGELFMPALSAKQDTSELIRKKFEKVNQYAPLVIDEMYKEFIKIEQKILNLVSRLGKTSS